MILQEVGRSFGLKNRIGSEAEGERVKIPFAVVHFNVFLIQMQNVQQAKTQSVIFEKQTTITSNRCNYTLFVSKNQPIISFNGFSFLPLQDKINLPAAKEARGKNS